MAPPISASHLVTSFVLQADTARAASGETTQVAALNRCAGRLSLSRKASEKNGAGRADRATTDHCCPRKPDHSSVALSSRDD